MNYFSCSKKLSKKKCGNQNGKVMFLNEAHW